MLTHDVVFINDVFRDWAEENLVLFMLCRCIVELKVLDVEHKVLGTGGQHHAVPIKFGDCEVRCWGGDWSIKCECVSSHCELHYVNIFLLGLNVTYDAAICDLGVLGDFVPVDEKIIVIYLYVL